MMAKGRYFASCYNYINFNNNNYINFNNNNLKFEFNSDAQARV